MTFTNDATLQANFITQNYSCSLIKFCIIERENRKWICDTEMIVIEDNCK